MSAQQLAGQMTQAFAARDRSRVERYDLGTAKGTTEHVTERKVPKLNKLHAGYRCAFSGARCASCVHARKDATECELVEGEIRPDDVCDLYAPEREDTSQNANNYFSAMVERYQMPSDDVSPEKAREILRDGHVNGKPLTESQRGMFGAAAGKDE
jgi:hypothetical protein